jgi:hypothetical protein
MLDSDDDVEGLIKALLDADPPEARLERAERTLRRLGWDEEALQRQSKARLASFLAMLEGWRQRRPDLVPAEEWEWITDRAKAYHDQPVPPEAAAEWFERYVRLVLLASGEPADVLVRELIVIQQGLQNPLADIIVLHYTSLDAAVREESIKRLSAHRHFATLPHSSSGGRRGLARIVDAEGVLQTRFWADRAIPSGLILASGGTFNVQRIRLPDRPPIEGRPVDLSSDDLLMWLVRTARNIAEKHLRIDGAVSPVLPGGLDIAQGQSVLFMPPDRLAELTELPSGTTEREAQALRLYAAGYSPKKSP